jgi:pimeloyl-ACP methyl ester carboxylesterase
MNIVYIHGAGASSESFNYIKSHVGNGIDLNYDNKDGFKANLERMLAELSAVDNIFFIAHSLGGVYALHISEHIPNRILGAVTLSTPYGGSEIAKYAKLVFPIHRLLHDISPTNWPILHISKIKLQHPWTNVVSVKGHMPFIVEPNDGVVTVSSQRARRDMELIEIGYNHYEVVLANRVIKIIKERIEKIKK